MICGYLDPLGPSYKYADATYDDCDGTRSGSASTFA